MQGDSERLQIDHSIFLVPQFGQSPVTQSSLPSFPQKTIRMNVHKDSTL